MAVRRLPDPIPPVRHEITGSYVARLARIHGMDFPTLWEQISQPIKPRSSVRRLVPDQLAMLTGRSVHQLAGALPELRTPAPDWHTFRHEPQPACHICTAPHPGGPVLQLLPHHRYVCVRHQIWIGPPDVDHLTTPLTDLPEVIHAQRRHLLLFQRAGWANTYDAVLTAILICAQLWSSPSEDPSGAWHEWVRRANILIPPGTSESSFSTARLCAAVYPEAISLAACLASPHWRLQARGSLDDRARFDTEIARLLAHPAYHRDRQDDPISYWADVSSRRPPVAPIRLFTDRKPTRTPHLHRPSLHAATRRTQQRHAREFDSTNRAGEALVMHRHVASVYRRAWNPIRTCSITNQPHPHYSRYLNRFE
ncbi:TniQ family protein [Streptomyces sp. NBC_00259]|uniref:TniQ family protein n=1 Tax=Streptomyces sp. NBC_00259 TaxID=2903643 RepID=UPI002E2CF3C2|nr:TniQ family protein [Streptomyces sp. NBC_00259]